MYTLIKQPNIYLQLATVVSQIEGNILCLGNNLQCYAHNNTHLML